MRTSLHHAVAAIVLAAPLAAGAPAAAQIAPAAQAGAASAGAAVTPPPDYVVGPEDVLSILVWREADLSTDVAVRPDGKITLPLINEVQAAGLTPEELRVAVTAAAAKFVEDPSVTVIVKQINSRRVYITGHINKPGTYDLSGPMTVLQLIALAGGVLEWADSDKILIMRTENGRPVSLRFNYDDVKRRRNLGQNIELKPGDTIVVP